MFALPPRSNFPRPACRRGWAWYVWLLIAPLLGLAVAWSADPPGESPTESQLKAAFVFNFTKFVTWPPGAFASNDSPLVVGVLGDPQLGKDLETLVHGKLVATRTVTVKSGKTLEDLGRCHVMFLDDSLERRQPELLTKLGAPYTLTVGETDKFIEQGGMIGFTRENHKIRFEVNLGLAERGGLKVSAQLLRLAQRILREKPAEP